MGLWLKTSIFMCIRIIAFRGCSASPEQMVQNGGMVPANSSSAIGTGGLRRRGNDAFVANLFLPEVLLFDASFLPVHAPWRILIPHSTTTMADTSVAAVNRLSKEATLILSSASQPR
jgi:hypothetical protein